MYNSTPTAFLKVKTNQLSAKNTRLFNTGIGLINLNVKTELSAVDTVSKPEAFGVGSENKNGKTPTLPIQYFIRI